MPVNPRYNFLNSDAQLGQGAFGAGNALWGGPAPEIPPQPERATPYIPSGVTPDVRQAVLMGRQQPAPAAPVAPATPRVRVATQAPRSQIIEQDLPPEQFAQEEMSPEFDLGTPSSMGRIVEPDHTPARPDFSEYEQTTLAKRGRDMGFDPRQLMVALAEFSAGMGNIKGKPQESSARSFYQMQKQEEGRADASRRADEAQRRQEMMMMLSRQPKAMDPIMQKYYEAQTQAALQRNAPKPDAPVDPLKQKYLEAQIENLNARTKNEQLGSQRATKGTAAAIPSDVAAEESVQVPGWKKTQNVPIEKTELKQFRDRSAKVPRVVEKIDRLKNMISKYGAYENPYGEAGVMMRQLSNDLKLDLKGPEFKALGVLAGPDMQILEALVPDPSSWQNAMRGDQSVTRSLDELKRNLILDLESGGKQLGFEKASAPMPQNAPAAPGSTGLPVYRPGGK